MESTLQPFTNPARISHFRSRIKAWAILVDASTSALKAVLPEVATALHETLDEEQKPPHKAINFSAIVLQVNF